MSELALTHITRWSMPGRGVALYVSDCVDNPITHTYMALHKPVVLVLYHDNTVLTGYSFVRGGIIYLDTGEDVDYTVYTRDGLSGIFDLNPITTRCNGFRVWVDPTVTELSSVFMGLLASTVPSTVCSTQVKSGSRRYYTPEYTKFLGR